MHSHPSCRCSAFATMTLSEVGGKKDQSEVSRAPSCTSDAKVVKAQKREIIYVLNFRQSSSKQKLRVEISVLVIVVNTVVNSCKKYVF